MKTKQSLPQQTATAKKDTNSTKRARKKIDYNARTARFQNASELFVEEDSLHKVDTILDGFHRKNKIDIFDAYRQDLGALGTASRSLWFNPEASNGVELGLDAYSYYAYRYDDVKFYNTYSPFTSLEYWQSAIGQLYFDGEFSRSAGDLLSIGFSLRRFATENQIEQNIDLRNYVNNYGSKSFLKFELPNKRYQALLSHRFFRNEVRENGGVFLRNDDSPTDSIFGDLEKPNLKNVMVQDRRNYVNLYQQLRLTDSANTFRAHVFHDFERVKRVNFYEDNELFTERDYRKDDSAAFWTNQAFYDSVYFGNTVVNDSLVYKSWVNKVGIKCSYKGNFLGLYFKNRQYADWQNDTIYRTGEAENYVGFLLKGKLIAGQIPFKAYGEYSGLGYNRSTINLSSKWVDFDFVTMTRPANLVQQRIISTHYVWENNFDLQQSTSLALKGHLYSKNRNWVLLPFIDHHQLNNWILYNKNAQPFQTTEKINLTRTGARIKYKKKIVNVDIGVSRQIVSDKDLWPTPDWMVNTLTYLEKRFEKKKLLLQLGADITWQSGYFAMSYDPLLLQFYLQDDVEIAHQPIIDLFVNAQIQTNARVYLKVTNVLQGLTGEGYLVTPGYFGRRRAMEVGVTWQFYD